MAHRAVLGGGNMVAVLALGRAAVMTALAVAGNARVIEIGGFPGDLGMAHCTILAGRQVVATLALRERPIMATAAIAGDTGVTEIGRFPGHR